MTPIINTLLLLGGLWTIFHITAPFLSGIVAGGIIAMVLSPMHEKVMQRFRLPRNVAAVLCCFVAYVGFLLPVGLLFWNAGKEGVTYISTIQWKELVAQFPMQRLTRLAPMNAESIRSAIFDMVQAASTFIVGWLGEQAKTLPSTLTSGVMMLLSSYFFLKEHREAKDWIATYSPFPKRLRDKLMHTISETTWGVVVGSFASALVQSVIVASGLMIFGIPNAFLLSATTFFASFVPVVGTAPVWVGACVYLYTHGSLGAAFGMAAFGVVASLSDNVVKPVLLRGPSALHPLVALIAILGGLNWLGVIGLFVGPVIVATLLALLSAWRETQGDMLNQP